MATKKTKSAKKPALKTCSECGHKHVPGKCPMMKGMKGMMGRR